MAFKIAVFLVRHALSQPVSATRAAILKKLVKSGPTSAKMSGAGSDIKGILEQKIHLLKILRLP